MNKFINFFLISVMLICLCSCTFDNIGNDEKDPVMDEVTEIKDTNNEVISEINETAYSDNEIVYETIETKYSDNNEMVDQYIKIAYPQITELENEYIEHVINDEIRETALRVLEVYDSLENTTINSEYLITCASNDILSIYFHAYITHAPANSLTFYLRRNRSANYLISTGEKIGLSDVININEDFINSFYDNFHIHSKYDSDEESKRIIDDDVKSTFVLDKLLLSDQDNFTEVCSYFTEDSLVISIAVRKASGSYALYEAKYTDIEEFINPRFKMLVENE